MTNVTEPIEEISMTSDNSDVDQESGKKTFSFEVDKQYFVHCEVKGGLYFCIHFIMHIILVFLDLKSPIMFENYLEIHIYISLHKPVILFVLCTMCLD